MLNGIWGFFFDWRNSDGRVSGQNGYGDGGDFKRRTLCGGAGVCHGRGNFGLVGGAEDCGAGRHD